MSRAVLFLLACAGATAHAADATTSPASVNLIQVTLSLLLVVGVLIGFAVLFKKLGLNRMSTGPFPVKIIGAVSIGNNQRLVVIEVGEEWILLGVTPQQINTITSMPRQEVLANGGIDKANFAGWMQTALAKYTPKNNAKNP